MTDATLPAERLELLRQTIRAALENAESASERSPLDIELSLARWHLSQAAKLIERPA